MTLMSGVFILPAAMRDAGNAFGEQMGWGNPSYSIPLSPTGAEPATHWGARADLPPSFFALMDAPPAEAQPLLDALILDVQDVGDPYGHWSGVIAAQGLKMVQGDGS